MSTMIDTIFEKGAFRPLKPVAIAENQRVKIRLEDAGLPSGQGLTFPRLVPSAYPEDDREKPESSTDYLPVPLKAAGTVHARFVFLGKLIPPVYPEE